MNCPLCQKSDSTKYDEDKFRTYYLCQNCSLVFIPRESILPFAVEAARYDAHENDDDDANYRNYLAATANAISELIPKNSVGLDFGCGRTLVMAHIFESHGNKVDSYDLYFHPKEDIWDKKYDFIVLSEVVEHLSPPAEVMKRLSKLLKFHGKIFIKTKLYPPDPITFHNWFYKRDQTHVQFFDYDSMTKLGQIMKMKGPHKIAAPDLYEFTK